MTAMAPAPAPDRKLAIGEMLEPFGVRAALRASKVANWMAAYGKMRTRDEVLPLYSPQKPSLSTIRLSVLPTPVKG